MQHELSKGPLLDEKGNLIEAGYAFELVKDYNRKKIKGLKSRIKEWDYYYIHDTHFGVALTIADNSYMNMISVSVIDYEKPSHITKSYMSWFTFGKTKLPSSSSNGDVVANNKNYTMHFFNNHGKRHLVCHLRNLAPNKDFHCDITLENTLDKSMVIATPFEKKRHFYYNQKINLLAAEGMFEYGNINHQFKKGKTLGVLDWGRGIWTYSNTWYWSSLNAYTPDGHRVGFNLGYGFGDTSAASENMFFYDKEAYKLEDVEFQIPKDEKGKHLFKNEWKLVSKNRDIDLIFKPIIDRYSNTNAILIQSNQHQVFGYFTGTIKIKDKVYRLDNLIGFAEMVKNRW